MKKTVKSLIIAASVAAIAGIGAVSFAAWDAGTADTKDVTNNQLGAVSVLKFDTTVETAAVTGLLPIDQELEEGDTTSKLYGEMVFQIEKSAAYEYDNFKLKVEINKTGTFATDTKFYAKATTAPTAAVEADEIDATNGIELTYEITESGNYKLYIYHDSSDMDDMNQKFNLTLTLMNGTAD